MKKVYLVAMVMSLVFLGTVAMAAEGHASELYLITQGDFSALVTAISGQESGKEFYAYNKEYRASSFTGYETSFKSLLFLYRDETSGELSLFMIHDRYKDDGGGNSQMYFYGLPDAAYWSVEDDSDIFEDEYYFGSTRWEARWLWGSCCTDGAVIGSINGFTKITVDPVYWSGINEWWFLTGDRDDPEIIKIPNRYDPVVITIAELPVSVDIKPQSCPNPVNANSNGVIPVAMLGTEDFDVSQIDPASITLAGVAPLRSDYEDVATPYTGTVPQSNAQDCTTAGADGYLDLTLKFSTQDVIAAISSSVPGHNDRETAVLTLSGSLLEEYGGWPVSGEDIIIYLDKDNNKGKAKGQIEKNTKKKARSRATGKPDSK
jgi:hypothetical protein